MNDFASTAIQTVSQQAQEIEALKARVENLRSALVTIGDHADACDDDSGPPAVQDLRLIRTYARAALERDR